MLHYPKIPDASGAGTGRCIAFEKLDGTNLHWDWDREFGWHAFGTRRDVFNLTPGGIQQFEAAHRNLVGASQVFHSSLADPLEQVFLNQPEYANFAGFKAFTEYLGPRSFAGAHFPDDPRQVVLFDVEAEGFGILSPFQFVRDFGHLPTPHIIYQGRYTGQLSVDVRNGKFPVAEGVVVKGGTGGADLWMVKIKTLAYLERLKCAFAEGWLNYWE